MHTQLLYPGASPDDGTGTVLRDAAFILNNMLLRLAGSSWRQPALATLNAPPLTPNHQQRWLIGATPTGAFAGKAGQIAEWVGTPPGAAPVNAWSFEPPTPGALMIDIAASSLLRWDGAAWVAALGSGAVDWGAITGKPDFFPPAAHSHAFGDLTAIPALISALAGLGGDGLVSKSGSSLTALLATAFGLSLLGAVDAPAGRALLGLGAAALLGTSGSGGVVTRGADLKIPLSDLPALLLNNTHEAASQAAMLALPAVKMDIVVRSDVGKTFVLGAEPATVLANWVELPNPVGGAITAVFGSTGPAVTVPGLPLLAGAIDSADEALLYDASTGTHRRVSLATLLAGTTSLTAVAPADIGTAANTGIATTAARADHVHKLPTSGVTAGTYANATVTVDQFGRVTGASSGTSGGVSLTTSVMPFKVTRSSPSIGGSGEAARADHSHQISFTNTSAIQVQGSALDDVQVQLTHSSVPKVSAPELSALGQIGVWLYYVPGGTDIRKATLEELYSLLPARAVPQDTDLIAVGPPTVVAGAAPLSKTTVAQLFTNRNITGGRLLGVREAKQARVDVNGSTTLPALDSQNTYHYRLTGNATLTLPARITNANTIIGVTIIIDQDATGGRTLTINAPSGETIKWHGGAMGSIATAANARTRIALSAAQGETRWDAAIVYKEA